MVLTGIIQCVNVCDQKYFLRYPKSHTILLACARALANPNIAAIYFSLLVQIQAHRNTSHEHHNLVDLQEVRRQLARDPEVELVRDLSESGRLWGCVAKHAADTVKFGEGICINEDIAQALESTQSAFVDACCSMLLCVSFCHEKMHLLHHDIFPAFRLERTPPEVASGESGWALEELLFGGQVVVFWPSQEAVGDMEQIAQVAVRTKTAEGSQLKMLTIQPLQDFVSAIQSGDIPKLTTLATLIVSEPPLPMVSARGQSVSTWVGQSVQWVGLGSALGLAPGQVAAFAGQDRLPFASLIYADT